MGSVVWAANAPVSRTVRYADALKALVFHYQRVFFGPDYKMG